MFWQPTRGILQPNQHWRRPQASVVGGDVTVDIVGTTKFQSSSNSFSYTGLTITGGLTNPGLIACVIRAHASNNVAAGLALTWGAQSMTLLKAQQGGSPADYVLLFGLRNPASGNQTLTVSATNIATDNWVNCVSFSNVNPTSDGAAFPNTAGSTSVASINVTSAVGHVAVGVFSFGSVGGTIIGTTVINDQVNGSIKSAGADYVISSGVSTTVGTTITQTAIAGVDISN